MTSTSNRYFRWLCNAVNGEDDYRVLNELYSRDFYALVPMDENRTADGLELRYKYARENGAYPNLDRNCSVLEMMVALSQRIDRNLMTEPDKGDQAYKWFWEMSSNLGLATYKEDFDSEYAPYEISCILDTFLTRTYHYDGEGGLFPLQKPKEDQRKVEIWYQMNAYLMENYVKIG